MAWAVAKNQCGSCSFGHFLYQATKPQVPSESRDMWLHQERSETSEGAKSLEAGGRLDTLGTLRLHTTAEDRLRTEVTHT